MIKSFYTCFSILLVCALGTIKSSYGQTYPIDANAVLIPPHSLYLPDYQLEKSQDLLINLTLNDPVEPFWDVRFRITISNNGVDILQTNPGYQPEPYRLNQFSTITLTGVEIADYLSFDNLVALNGYAYTGILPEGLNSICIEVLDYNRQDIVLSRQACGSGYAILNDPPFPQLPLCETDVDFQQAQNIMFTWLPMHLGSPNPVSSVQYEFTLVRVENGYNQYEAIEAASPLYQETTSNTSIILQDPILEGGYTYAWRVRVVDGFDGSELNSFKNDGYSVVCSFNYLEQEQVVDLSELYDDSSTQCSASCQGSLPSNSEIITELAVGDVVQIGKFFMNIKKITSASGGFFSGTGYVFIPFLLSNMNVTFEDMTVNTDGVVFSGEIVTDIDSELLTDNFSSTEGDMTVDADQISAINDLVESEGRQSSQADQGSSLGLPIALDKSVGGVSSNLIITGISFEPDVAYLNAVISFGSEATGDQIAFGGKGICFHPYGIGGGTAELFLNEDFSLGDYSDLDLTFKAPGNGSDGTYITFDCTGLQEINIEGEYEFSQEKLLAADGLGNPVTASFSINTTEWGQFIADIDMDAFEINGVDGYSFTISEGYLDFSDVANQDNMEFPEDYEETEDTWRGFYLSELTMAFPDDLAQSTGDLSVGVQNMLIDHSGVSASVFAAGILELESGRLGEWAFSVDTVQIDIVSNSLVEGSLLGQIHVPILDEENSLNYSALMTDTDDGLGLLFTINTEEDVNVSMWAAEMTLSSSSVIAIEKTDNGFTPYAELHGDLTMDVEIQEGNSFEIEAMAFEGLKINHPDESKRIAVDAFSLFGGGDGFSAETGNSASSDSSEEEETLAGFPLSINNVSFEEGDGSEAAINFDLDVNLTGDELGVTGSTNLQVIGEYDASGAPFKAWDFQGVELNNIEVDAELAAGSIQGSLDVYKGDETYGSGFKGLISAQFTGIGEVDALAQFGKIDGYRYFFVDAMLLSQSPIVDVLGVGLYGFGGGMYHHMSRDDSDPAMNLEEDALFAEPDELGASLSGIVYTPDKETLLGLKATLTMGIAPGTSFSADANFEASFGVSNNAPSIQSIAFGGKAYFMSPGTILDRIDSKVIGQFDANLDLSDPYDPVFTGIAQVDFDTKVITGSGSAAMKFSDKDSYIWIGTPSNPVSIGIEGMGTFDMYADMGSKVPSMPSISDLVPNYSGDFISQRPSDLGGTKIIFGASFNMPKKSYSYGSFYASAQFGIGFDAYLRQVSAADCGIANGTIGIKSWYLSGQAYAYGSGNVGLNVDTWFYSGKVNILDLSASVVMQAELPNPTWLQGSVNINYSILKGAIKGNVDYSFEVGEQCEITENPISGISVIADVSPKNGENNVNCFANPIAVVNIPINEIMTVEQLDSDGEVTVYEYQPYVAKTSLEEGNNDYLLKIEENGDLIVLDQNEMLEEFTTYTCNIKVKWKKRKEGESSWEILDGNESKEFSFTTGAKPEYIPSDAVSFALPMPDRRNVYDRKTDQYWAIILETSGWQYLFDDNNFDYVIQATNMTTGSSIEKSIVYTESLFSTGAIFADVSKLTKLNQWLNDQDGALIKAEVIAKYNGATSDATISSETTEETSGVQIKSKKIDGTRISTSTIEDKTIHTWYFRKSDFDTPEDKLAAWTSTSVNQTEYKKKLWIYGKFSLYENSNFGNFSNSNERFDLWDLNSTTYQIGIFDFTLDPVFKIQKIDWEKNGSFEKSQTDRVWELKAEAESLGRDIYNFQAPTWQTQSTWNQNIYDIFGLFDESAAWGEESPYAGMYCNYCKELLTEDEKESGNADIGYTSSGNTSIRFYNNGEELVLSYYSSMFSPVVFLADPYDWYDLKNWQSSGSWNKSSWIFNITNPDDSRKSGTYEMNHK